jgi:monofunctional biosynthetic peptidoglycan transglycosylase
LNVIEFGKGIYGIQNASHYYFKKSAKDLTAKEGAFLAMLLPNPKKYAKSFHQKMLTPFAKSIIESILSKMEMAGFIGAEEREINLSRPLVFETKSIAKANESDTSIFQDESNLDEDVND